MKGHPGGHQYEPFCENRAPMRDILNFSNIIYVFTRDILIADEAPRRTSRTKPLKNRISWGLDLRFHPRRPHRRRNVDEDVSSENDLSRVPTRDVLIGAGCEMRMSRMGALLKCDFRRDVSSENAKKDPNSKKKPIFGSKRGFLFEFWTFRPYFAQKSASRSSFARVTPTNLHEKLKPTRCTITR